VLAAIRYDTELLLPEQRTRLQNVVAKQTVLGFEDPTKEAADVNFLVECLEDEDLAVRTRAKGMLEQVLGRKIEFDPAAAPEKRATVAAAIRVDLAHTAADRRDLDKPLQLP
jgi:predicted nucleotidyltransferase